MKNLVILMLSIWSLASLAETIVVMDTELPRSTMRSMDRPHVSDKFFMDTFNDLGYADIKVTVTKRVMTPRIRTTRCAPHYRTTPPRSSRSRVRAYPTRRCMPQPPIVNYITRTVLDRKVEIPNLRLVDNQMIYYGINGEVNCGSMGRSRVLNTPTLYLTGNCKLTSKIRRNRLIVEFRAR